MKIISRLFITASKVFPGSYKKAVEENLIFAGIEVDVEVWLGISLIIGLLTAFVVALMSKFGNPLLFYILAIVVFFIYQLGSYSIPYFQAINRAESVDQSLPSVLQLMASNIRAGMTPFQAIKVSTRAEFGVLTHELDRATAKALGTGSFSDALLEINKRLNSHALNRAIKLFIRSVESGSYLAKTLEETARDISENIILKRELISSTRTYTMLIMFSVLIGTPMLLTISVHFTEKMAQLKSSLQITQIEGLEMNFLIGEGFSTDFLVNVSTIIILFTTLIASLLMGVIVEGKEKYGLKYAFFLVPLSLIIFYLMRFLSGILLK